MGMISSVVQHLYGKKGGAVFTCLCNKFQNYLITKPCFVFIACCWTISSMLFNVSDPENIKK